MIQGHGSSSLSATGSSSTHLKQKREETTIKRHLCHRSLVAPLNLTQKNYNITRKKLSVIAGKGKHLYSLQYVYINKESKEYKGLLFVY